MGVPVIPERRIDYRTEDTTERMGSGNPEADYILGGGFPANSINIVMGHPGSGKTIFAEQLIFHNAGDDRPILYFTTLSEPLAKVVRYLQGFDFYDWGPGEIRLVTAWDQHGEPVERLAAALSAL